MIKFIGQNTTKKLTANINLLESSTHYLDSIISKKVSPYFNKFRNFVTNNWQTESKSILPENSFSKEVTSLSRIPHGIIKLK